VTTVGIVFVTGGTGCRSSFARHPAEGATAAAETATTASARQPSKQLRRAVSYPLSQRQCRRVQQTARSCKDIFVIRNWRRLTGCIHSCEAADLHVLGNRVSRVTRSTILFQPVADTGLDTTPRPGQASRTDQWPVASCRRARQRCGISYWHYRRSRCACHRLPTEIGDMVSDHDSGDEGWSGRSGTTRHVGPSLRGRVAAWPS
jgi:hypothetical protein